MRGTNWKWAIGICLVIVSCILVIAPQALAQPRFTGIYPIQGEVADPDNVGTEGRKVILYKDDTANGFSDDLVGTSGWGGVADEYRLNAFEDWRMSVAPGKYKVAIVKSAVDSYGADPVEVDLTGYGYDTAPQLVLMFGAGAIDPGDRPSENLPTFDYIQFGNRLYQAGLVAEGKEYIISSKPVIKARVISPIGLNLSSVAMVLNDGTATAKTYNIKSANIVTAAGPAAAPTDITFTYDLASENQDAIPEGSQQLTFKAANSYGEAIELATVTVAGGEPRLLGVPIPYPSPVRLLSNKYVTLQYTLSHDLNIDIHMLDLTGRVVKKFSFNAREEGGSAGINKVVWDLKTQQGSIISAAIYVFTIIDRDNNKLLGKGKFTAIGQ